MEFVEALPSWSPTDLNPFTANGSFGAAWSCFSIEESLGGNYLTKRTEAGCWLAQFGPGVPDLMLRLVDFVAYENANQRTVILHLPTAMRRNAVPKLRSSGRHHPGKWRPTDPPVLVHSTDLESWTRIKADGKLSSAYLRSGGVRTAPSEGDGEVLRYLDAEPDEYSEFVMFAELGSIAPEVVLASRSAGRFELDPDVPYVPGVRLYLDNRRIVDDGNCVRDGIHVCKVRGTVPLQRYLLQAVSVDDLEALGIANWTPKTFMTEADRLFQNRVGNTGSANNELEQSPAAL